MGKPRAIEEGAHAHDDCVELDLKEGQPGNPNANTPKGVAHAGLDSMPGEVDPIMNMPVHLEGMGPEVLIDVEKNHLLKVEEDGATRKTVSVKGDISPCVELQDPGVSCLAMQEVFGSLTLPSPPLYITLEAASMQCSLAANIGMLDIPVPDHSVDLELLPHNPLPPNKAVESSDCHSAKQSQAPTKAGGPLELLPGEDP